MFYLDKSLLHDELALLARESVLQTVPEEELHRHRLSELVGAGTASGGVDAAQLVQHPGLGGCQALEVLLRTANHGCGLLKRKLNRF